MSEQACIFCKIVSGQAEASLLAENDLWMAHGEAAFQDVFHTHRHVFPRLRAVLERSA